MTRVGIITFHAAHNYGSVFQAYAMQKSVLKLGYACEIINLRTPAQREMYAVLTKRKGFRYLLKNAYYLIHIRNRIKKYKRFERYIYEKYVLSPQQYNSNEELVENPPNYDYYISGSDQIWNVTIADWNTSYFLPFVRRGKRIAYAPSFGPIGRLDEAQKERIKKYLFTYDSLSAREISGSELIEELTGIKAPVLVDPTLLLDKNEWNAVAKPVKTPERYIFFYTLFANSDMITIVKHISKALHLPVITPYISNQFDMVAGFKKVTDCGPEEFISYIKNATLVITSSFHGNAFSILYEKPFFAVNGMEDKRINTLLSKVALTDRAITADDFLGKIEGWETIDFSASRAALDIEKKKSLKYLSDALSGKETDYDHLPC